MIKLIKKTFCLTFAFVLFFAQAQVAQAGFSITGNGTTSVNKIKVVTLGSSSLLQSNKAKFTNSILGSSSTGGNNGSLNTGGQVQTTTGDAGALVEVGNTANSNLFTASGGCECDCQTAPDATINENGASSWNKIKFTTSCSLLTSQWNSAKLTNSVVVGSSTGENTSSGNTGAGVTLSTGESLTTITVVNTANVNTAQ